MGHAGASRKSPNDASWEKLSLRLGRPISAPLLTVARSWRHEEEDCPIEKVTNSMGEVSFISSRDLKASRVLRKTKFQEA